jgi:Xaa-Pro aminopeptidase/Xaa-Pro dipeptidase
VVTVEPGAYRVGVGGARVEELLLVTDTGHRVLSNSPKEPTCPQSPPTTSRTE